MDCILLSHSKAIVFLICIVVLFVLFFLGKQIYKHSERPKFDIMLYVFVLIFLLKIFVTFSGNLDSEDMRVSELSIPERIMDSILHTFQTFSMDEDYTKYIIAGKNALSSKEMKILAEVYGCITYALFIIAPILGGSIILDQLANFFPIIQLWRHPFCHKFIFSELNEMSISLAEDIANGKHNNIIHLNRWERKPLIVFTDVYTDPQSETSSELLARAKALKTVCVQKDLSKLSFKYSKSVMYLLMDQNASNSISAFSVLMENGSLWPHAKRKLKCFSLIVELDRHYEMKHGASFQDWIEHGVEFSLKAIDMFGNNVKLLDYSGKEVTNDKLKKHFASAKYEGKNLTLNFDFSDEPLDHSRPFSIEIRQVIWKQLFDLSDEEASQQLKYKVKLEPEFNPRTQIYIFIQEETQYKLIQSIYAKNEANLYQLMVRVIRDYHNTVINLMSAVPLFFPLCYKYDYNWNTMKQMALNVTIFGGGAIAQEVFKAVYWCGQMPNVQLNITVLTNNVCRFKDEISASCPELFESQREGSSMLSVYKKVKDMPDRNPPYINALHINYIRDVRNLNRIPESLLSETDYFVIALGSDEMGAEMTNLLCSKLAKLKVAGKSGQGTVIVPAIFNRIIADAIENKKINHPEIETFVVPFAVLDERFNCENVFMEKHREKAEAIEELYNRSHQIKQQKDEYVHWSNIARALHAPYKLFGLGFLKLKDKQNPVFGGSTKEMYDFVNKSEFKEKQKHEQAWIEHRRWNAFLRAHGFRSMTLKELKNYYKTNKKTKDIQFKLHPCLVESSLSDNTPLPDTFGFDPHTYDRLDYVSMMAYRLKIQKDGGTSYYGEKLRECDENYKKYDTFEWDDALKALIE